MTQAICGVNASCGSPSAASSPDEGTGGAPATQADGARGAGNVLKRGEPEASLRCLPELVLAAKECGKSILVRNLTSALACGLRLEALRQCVVAEEVKAEKVTPK